MSRRVFGLYPSYKLDEAVDSYYGCKREVDVYRKWSPFFLLIDKHFKSTEITRVP